MSNDRINESKEWRKFLEPLVKGLITFLVAATLYLQHSESAENDVKFDNVETSLHSMDVWREKTEVKIDASSKEISTLNVQLAQVLVKIDNVIDCLKELKDANRR